MVVYRTPKLTPEQIGNLAAAGARVAEELQRELAAPERDESKLLTVTQAAERLGVDPKTIRRRLPTWEARGLAQRIGDGPRSPWRIHPDALTMPAETVEPTPAEQPRGRRKSEPKKRSATRWEL